MPFNPLNYPIAFTAPRLVSQSSAWAGHIPFAMALVDMLRPRLIVELGTHQGDSYCAFCQAVAALSLTVRCAAIDTWKGDVHSGFYGSEVLANLRQVHDPLYGRFSRLIQSTFDDAVSQFQNGSIDLLHIDGLHTYDAVKHDYETWLAKMSASGIILFHDVMVQAGNAGVHRLWQEISPGRPNMLFEHSFGLGVLAVGNALPPALLEFFHDAARDPRPIRACFARLGEAVEMIRYLKNLTSWQLRTQELVNQWKARRALTIDPRSTDLSTAFADVIGYAKHVTEEVALALSAPPQAQPMPIAEPLEPKRISIIICSINPQRFSAVSEMYRRVMGTTAFEIIAIHDAKSLAEGYNRAITRATGDVLIFSHDDIEFITPQVPDRLLRHLQTYDVIGLAGTTKMSGISWVAAGPPHIFGQITHPVSEGGFNVILFGAPCPVIGNIQAIDGVFLAANRNVIDKICFDESFDGFHFYDLDFSLCAWQAGFKLAVANDLHAIHQSPGKTDEKWNQEAGKFAKKWGARFPMQPNRIGNWADVHVATREEILPIVQPAYWKS